MLEHVQKMFELAGDKPEVAAAEAKTVLAIETGLAKAAMDRTARRDPKNRDHMMHGLPKSRHSHRTSS